MSYMRIHKPLTYVDGVSEDYVFLSDPGNFIEDYGGIKDSTIVEFVAEIFDFNNSRHLDDKFREYVLHKLADKLDVKLRPKKLTFKQWMKLLDKLSKVKG